MEPFSTLATRTFGKRPKRLSRIRLQSVSMIGRSR
jgi:hypothetical protein